MKIFEGLQDSNGADITSMGASWTSKGYEVGRHEMLCVHLLFDSATPTGTLFLEVSGVPVANDPEDLTPVWETLASKTLTAVDSSVMFLENDLPVPSFRLRFVRTGGNANIDVRTTLKP